MPPQEWTEGSDPTPTVPIDGAITTKITQAAAARATAATVRCELQPKNTSSLLAGPPEGITLFTVAKNPCNKRRKGATGGGTPDTGHD
jgi:hypothetical protein